MKGVLYQIVLRLNPRQSENAKSLLVIFQYENRGDFKHRMIIQFFHWISKTSPHDIYKTTLKAVPNTHE